MQYGINNKEDMKALNNAMSYKLDRVEIMDPNADTEKDLLDSYIGKYIAKCDVCQQLIYIDSDNLKDEITVCPYCGFEDCFTLVGQVSALPIHSQKCINADEDALDNELSPKENIYGKCYKEKR